MRQEVVAVMEYSFRSATHVLQVFLFDLSIARYRTQVISKQHAVFQIKKKKKQETILGNGNTLLTSQLFHGSDYTINIIIRNKINIL